MKLLLLALLLLVLGAGCDNSARAAMHNAEFAMAAQDFEKALGLYEKVLEKQPDSVMGLFGKARALYELKRYAEAKPLFEMFLTKTEVEQAQFRKERYDAEFYRDKCKQELGETVEADPSKIPPPPMGE
jgi:tetratricopeptide (TPR) repeat protein